METMNNLLISTLAVLALSILCFLLGGAGVAGAVTGGGQASGATGAMFFFAKLLLGLALVLGALWLIRSPSR
jgi:phosphoglycerol transferase MdoB-like AlkP superfamily enzyme